jgi:hypothetical protein
MMCLTFLSNNITLLHGIDKYEESLELMAVTVCGQECVKEHEAVDKGSSVRPLKSCGSVVLWRAWITDASEIEPMV